MIWTRMDFERQESLNLRLKMWMFPNVKVKLTVLAPNAGIAEIEQTLSSPQTLVMILLQVYN